MAKKTAKKVIKIPAHLIEAVENGIKFLDFMIGRKEWLSRMDMTNFDIESPSTCVAGNVFDNSNGIGFSNVQEALTALGVDSEKGPKKFGFNANSDKEMQFLQDIWVRRINAMKRAARIK